jgi:hypothetical protein
MRGRERGNAQIYPRNIQRMYSTHLVVSMWVNNYFACNSHGLDIGSRRW